MVLRAVLLLAVLLAGLPVAGAARAGPPRPGTDRHGDPLPPGAALRLGTVRFRHADDLTSLAFSPDGKALAGFGLRDIVLWDAPAGRRRQRIPGAVSAGGLTLRCPGAFSPDGKTLAQASCPRAAECLVRFFRAGEPKCLCEVTLPGDDEQVNADLAFSPDGRLLAVRPGRSDVALIAVQTGKVLRTLKVPFVVCFAFSPDGKQLAAVGLGDDGVSRCVLWDVQTGAKGAGFSAPRDDTVSTVAFSPQGGAIVLGTGTGLLVLSGDGRTEVARLGAPGGRIGLLAFAAGGKALVSGAENGEVRVWDWAAKKTRLTLKAAAGPLAVSPDGATLAAAPHGFSDVRVWDLRTGQEVAPPAPAGGHRSPLLGLTFSPDGTTLVSGDSQESVCCWDLRAGGRLSARVKECAHHLAFLPDGKGVLIVPWSEPQAVRFWAPGSPNLRPVVKDPHGKDSQGFWAAAVVRQGRALVTVANKRRPDEESPAAAWVALWELETGKRLSEVTREGVEARSLAVTPDGKTGFLGDFSGQVLFVDLTTGKDILSSPAHAGDVVLALSADGRSLASASSDDDAVRVWEVLTGKEVVTFKRGQGGAAPGLAISPDGRRLAAGEGDSVHVWDLLRGQLIRTHRGADGGVRCLAFSPGGRRLAGGMRDGTVVLWDADPPGPGGGPHALADKDRSLLWEDLASLDARRGYGAVGRLVSDPVGTVAFLRARLRPARPVEAKELQRLLQDLAHPRFPVRQAAFQELARLEEQAERALRRALELKPAGEQRRRIEQLLSLPRVVRAPDRLRPLRAVQVLEYVATAAAASALQALAAGDPKARLTREAAAALERLCAARK